MHTPFKSWYDAPHARLSWGMVMQAAPKVGSILLGKYRVERVLGQGGMGFVVAVRHETLGELYAIKLMLPEALKFKDARERFVREARAAARLKSEHVAHVHDVGALENGAPYMLMEHLHGEDLKHILDKRGSLPVEEAALYVYQACEAIAEAHALGIAHRDLKPANMFLTRRPNGTPCVKVLDFGISKDVNTEKVGPALTKTGMALGTPVYMAPEQMANTKTTDLRSDIWALGIILYELVTGNPPFLAEAMTELIAQVLTGQPVPLSKVRPGIPPNFDALVLRCLTKSADQRFATVRDLMAALQPFMTQATPSLSHTVAGIQDPLPAPRAEVKDTTTVEIAKEAETAPLPAHTVYGAPMLPTIPLAPNMNALGVDVPRPPIPSESIGTGQTGGAWGGTSRIFASKKQKPWAIAFGIMNVMVLLLLIAFVLTRSDEPPEAPSAATSAAPVESAAPVISATPPIADNPQPAPTQEMTPPIATPEEKPVPNEPPPRKPDPTSRTNWTRPLAPAPAPRPTTTSSGKHRTPKF